MNSTELVKAHRLRDPLSGRTPALRGAGPRFRRDLEWYANGRGEGGDEYWIAKDPVSLKFFRLREDERYVLSLLDGVRSVNEIRDHYNRKYAPRKVTSSQIQRLIIHFFNEGIVITDGTNQASRVGEKRGMLEKNRLKQFAMSWLFFRFPGIYANQFSGWMEKRLRPMLQWPFLMLATVAFLLAVGVLVTRAADFQRDLLDFQRWSSVHGIVLLAVVVGACKTLHEIGHAIACKRFGGECYEIGIMLMFGIPCLYCDTTDAWRFSNSSHRMLINAGGIIAEMLIGTLAVFIWHSTHPGILHYVSLDIILVCFLGSLLFNANPLLRYDGYYFLSDWIGIANLQAESKQAWQRFTQQVTYGQSTRGGHERNWRINSFLVVYHLAASIYRFVLLITILGLVFYSTKASGYEGIGWLFLLVAFFLLALTTLVPKVLYWAKQIRRQRFHPQFAVRCIRATLVRSSIIGLVLILLLFPFRNYVTGVGEFQPVNLQPIVSTVPGTLQSWTDYGSKVSTGEVIAQLDNSRTKLDALKAVGEFEEQRLSVEALKLTQLKSNNVAAEVPAAEMVLTSLLKRKNETQQMVDQLTIRSLKQGYWIEPTRIPRHSSSSAIGTVHELGAWTNLPLDDINQGCWIDTGTLLGWVGDLDSWEVVVLVPQSRIEQIQIGQNAKIYSSFQPDGLVHGVVKEISHTPVTRLSPRHSAWPGVINSGASSGSKANSSPAESVVGTPPGIEPLETSYWVTIQLDSNAVARRNAVPSEQNLVDTSAQENLPIVFGEVRASIEVERRSLFFRAWRWATAQFRM